MADVSVTEFTDPGCPWAFSAEPFRRRLMWLYGEQMDWTSRMVVLSESPEDYLARGFTAEKMAAGAAQIQRDHGMPIDTRVKSRPAATLAACLAVVASRVHAPDRYLQLLRCLRVMNFEGGLLDDPQLVRDAAATAELDPDELESWMLEPRVVGALAEDMRLAREPIPAARVLDEKLANWSGGRRYTCPSYEIVRNRDDVRIAIPGFQPFAAYDVVLANLVPDTDRREPPETVEEVLRWAGTPLATKEVAVVRDIPLSQAREELGRVAVERHVGADGYWTLAA
jgi:predicted DsbA family dithiol-disulfide isomerase